MNTDEISATGQFAALSPAEFAGSYRTPDSPSSPRLQPVAPPEKSTAAAATPIEAVTPGVAKPTTQEIDTAVATANANLSGSNRQLDYRVDAGTGITIAMIRNSQTGVVMQQIPGADIIALAKLLAAWAPGKHMMLDLIA
jgi:uncharacterized FlaG/YvyC family protein